MDAANEMGKVGKMGNTMRRRRRRRGRERRRGEGRRGTNHLTNRGVKPGGQAMLGGCWGDDGHGNLILHTHTHTHTPYTVRIVLIALLSS